MANNPVGQAPATESAWTLLFGAWLLSCVATLGAMFLSEIMKIPPCSLCWYQRIFMFPLAILLPLGLFPLDRRIVRYTLPLALLGWLVGAFHLLLMHGVIPESLKPCSQGVPCTDIQIEWFGFVTIPLLSLLSFTIIVGLLSAAYLRIRE
jgi:disulfide bond formation protein DsbB